jgi:hypothetical protein
LPKVYTFIVRDSSGNKPICIFCSIEEETYQQCDCILLIEEAIRSGRMGRVHKKVTITESEEATLIEELHVGS